MTEGPEVFRPLNPQGVESSSGFVVQHTGRFTLEYREGGFCMECSVEASPDGGLVAVPRLPFGNLTSRRRARIMDNIRAALEFMGEDYQVR